MRATVPGFFDKTLTIRRNTPGVDTGNGAVASWGDVVGATAVPCRLSPAGRVPDEREVATQLANVAAWTITVAQGTDVRDGDRLVIDARTFEVVKALARSYEVHRRIVATEVV